MNTTPITFGGNILRIRNLIGAERGNACTQEEFSRLVHRGRSQVANWEGLNKKPKDDKIEDLAWIFGIPFDVLKYGIVTELGAGWQTRTMTPRHQRLNLAREEIHDCLDAILKTARTSFASLEREIRRMQTLIDRDATEENIGA